MITRKDIANQLGVSVSVVSRALNNSGYVDKEKKRQIIELAKELGYGKMPAALSDGYRKRHQILFYCREFKNPYNLELYEGIIETATEHGYNTTLLYANDFDVLSRFEIDGVIFSNESLAIDYLNGPGKNIFMPAVCCSYGYGFLFPRSMPLVECDLATGMRMLIDYIMSMGHRKIALVTSGEFGYYGVRENTWKSTLRPVLGDRFENYYFSIQDPVLYHEENQHVTEMKNFYRKGAIGAQRFIESGCDATAVICFNEEIAMGFSKWMTQMDKRIPEDYSLAAFDGTYLQHLFDRPLTTLNMHPFLQGQKSAEALINLIEGRKAERRHSIPVELIPGKTVAAV